MRILQINLNYRTKEAGSNPRELTENYINFAFLKKYPDGIDGQLKGIVGRIQRKLSNAIEKKRDSIELEEAEYTLIQKAMDMAKFPSALCQYVMILEEALMNVETKEDKGK